MFELVVLVALIGLFSYLVPMPEKYRNLIYVIVVIVVAVALLQFLTGHEFIPHRLYR